MNDTARWLAIAAISALASGAIADTLAQKHQHKYSQGMADDAARALNNACDTSITAAYDWTEFDKQKPTDDCGNLGYQPGQFARECMYGIQQLCKLDDAKAAIKDKLKKVTIAFGGVGNAAVSMAGGGLIYAIDPKHNTSEQTCRKWILNHL